MNTVQATFNPGKPAVTRTIVDIPATEDTVTLTLPVSHAETLRAVCARIGGIAETSRRGHTDAINSALRVAGVLKPQTHTQLGLGDAIYFADEDL